MPLPLIIILSILALLIFLLCCRIKIEIIYDGEFHYIVKYLFYKYRINSTDKGKNTKKNSAKKKKKKKKSKKPQAKKGQPFKIDINTVENFLEIFSEIWKKTSSLIYKIRKGVTVENFVLDLTVASDDAAKTAITYGTACAVIYPVEALLEDLVRVRKKKLGIKADFNSTEGSLGFYVRAGMPLGRALSVGIIGTIRVVAILSKKMKKPKGDNKNERTSNTKSDGHNLAKNP